MFSRLADGWVGHGHGGGFDAAGERFLGGFAVRRDLAGHAAVAQWCVAEGEEGVQRRLFEAGFSIIGSAAGLIIIEPGVLRVGPTGAEDHMAVRDVEQVAGPQIARAGQFCADGRQLGGVMHGGQLQAARDEAGIIDPGRLSAHGGVVGPAFFRRGNITTSQALGDGCIKCGGIIKPAPLLLARLSGLLPRAQKQRGILGAQGRGKPPSGSQSVTATQRGTMRHLNL